MSQHTKEPWRAIKESCQSGDIGTCSGDDSWFSINSPDWSANGYEMNAEANARRIVACVNACAGIDTEWLEHNQKRIAPSGWTLVPIEPTSEMQDTTDSPVCLAVWDAMLKAAPAQKPNLGPIASPMLDKIDALTRDNAILQENHNAALADIAAVIAAYNESKSSPMTTKLRMAIEKLEAGLARAGGEV